MKATIHIDLNVARVEEAQTIFEDICRALQSRGKAGDYRYEIETAGGPVTERCVLADGKVIA